MIKITIKAGYFSALNYKSVWFSFDRESRNSEITFYRPYISFFVMKWAIFGQKCSILSWKCSNFGPKLATLTEYTIVYSYAVFRNHKLIILKFALWKFRNFQIKIYIFHQFRRNLKFRRPSNFWLLIIKNSVFGPKSSIST